MSLFSGPARRLVWSPLRASSDHRFIVGALRARMAPGRCLSILLRPRVARAQKIIRLHPLLCSGSTGPTWVSFPSFLSCAFC